VTRLANSLDGLADETAVSVGNSGGANGDAFTAVNTVTGDVLVADSAKASHGANSLRVAKGANVGRIGVEWTVAGWPTVYGRCRLWLDAWPTTGEVRFVTVTDATPANLAGLAVNTSGLIAVYDANGFVSSSTGNTVPVGQWVRIDWSVVVHPTAGVVEAKVYSDPNGVTPTFTKTSSNRDTDTGTAGTSAARVRYGRDSGPANAPAFWLDNLVASSVSYADLDDPPPEPPPPSVGTGWRVASHPIGPGEGGWYAGTGPPLPASVVIDEPPPPPPPPPVQGTNLAFAEGVWMILQPNTLSALQSQATRLRGLLNRPGIEGLSLRVPWRELYTPSQVWDPAIPDYGIANITGPIGKKLDLRPMSGRFTPSWASSRNHDVVGLGQTWQVPVPFGTAATNLTAGTPGNPLFEQYYQIMVSDAAAWSRANGIRLLHLPWYGRLWNEYDNDDVQDLTGYGPDITVWHTAHKRLMDFGLDATGPDLMVEWPASGHPSNANRTPRINADIHVVFNYGASRVGDYSDRGPMNTSNGWGGVGITQPVGSVPGGSGSDARNSARTLAGYQAWANRLQTQRYSWTSDSTSTVPIGMFALAKQKRMRRCEVYDDAFEEAEAVNLFAGALDYRSWLTANPTLVAPG